MAAYVIQPGDTPMGIARKFGMSFDQFKAANPGLCDANNNCRVLFPGQILQVIPPNGAPQPAPTPAQPAAGFVPQAPPWMEVALREQGVAEWNPGDNPRIIEYLASVGVRGGDETSWCAAFVNWSLRRAGFRGHGTGLAGQWIGFGRAVAPTYGCIVVTQPLSAGASGHVGFLHAMDQKNVWLLSGNSANRVRISAYSRGKLAAGQCFRWPV
ncbi:LysM peptidoglycan-binding domain-containing protein [Prosthecobacter sp.]|jgi:uncharacterized protein (TIGR02594 family)|uniref:LysM peptidoglycan-binding domain-containing protein n=1 Tax=Prosthecobacter sp. TaxID=1965333 RepID=UPI003783622C